MLILYSKYKAHIGVTTFPFKIQHTSHYSLIIGWFTMALTLKLVATLFLATLVACDQGQKCEVDFFPMPRTCTTAAQQSPVRIDPCSVLYKIDTKVDLKQPFLQLLTHYQTKAFFCNSTNIVFTQDQNPSAKSYILTIKIDDPKLQSVFEKQQEKYKLNIGKEEAQLWAATYVGFVRGIETFSQAFNCSKHRKSRQCALTHLPIVIEDSPQFPYRGIMIDTARHFLPLHLIFETIDALMYNKMSVLHWHITDEDSFPLILNKHPEIAQYAAFSQEETYTVDEAKEVVRYAFVRGIRVIPELDTPGHAASWGKAPQNKEIACTFSARAYMGPLDITRTKTYQILRDVLTEISQIFIDPIIHFGGDEVSLNCLTNRTEFEKQFNPHNLGLEQVYRMRQKQILKEINPNKHPMFWETGKVSKVEPEDIVHWWGGGFPQGTSNKIVISNYGPYYLDMGVGNFLGSSYGTYTNWLDFYYMDLKKQLERYENKQNVIGAEATLWSQVSNKHTHHIKIWMRCSSFAEKLWNSEVSDIKPGVMRRINVHQRLMNRRGIPTAPITSQQCEIDPNICAK